MVVHEEAVAYVYVLVFVEGEAGLFVEGFGVKVVAVHVEAEGGGACGLNFFYNVVHHQLAYAAALLGGEHVELVQLVYIGLYLAPAGKAYGLAATVAYYKAVAFGHLLSQVPGCVEQVYHVGHLLLAYDVGVGGWPYLHGYVAYGGYVGGGGCAYGEVVAQAYEWVEIKIV